MFKKKKSVEESSDKSIKFSEEEQKKIVQTVLDAIDTDTERLDEWQRNKAQHLKRALGCSPSELESLSKLAWMSDRDMGVCGATCDALRSTLLATVYNPDLISVDPTETNDIDRSKNVKNFMKWAVSDTSKNITTELLSCISNAVWCGVAFVKVGWKREVKYINERKADKDGKITYEYGIKTVTEDAFFENVDDVDDILCPDYGKDINDLDHFIRINHMDAATIKKYGDSGKFINVTDGMLDNLQGMDNAQGDDTQKGVKDRKEGIKTSTNLEKDASVVDVFEYYGWYDKNGKNEKYRFYVEKESKTFLGGKPLRDIVPSCRLPYVSMPFDLLPGKIRGRSLVELIKDVTDQINVVFNQNTDFQMVQNVPFSICDESDNAMIGHRELIPGKIYPSSSPANFRVINNQASFSWSDSMLDFLMSQVERISGSAGYFLTTESKNTTATRDAIVDQRSKTRYGLWVSMFIRGISEAMNLMFEQYQYFAPASLGTRVLGKDGKQLFNDFKPADILGRYDIKITEDIAGGSQAFKANIAMKRYEIGKQSPFIVNNPNGLWELENDTMRDIGVENPDKYMTKQPPSEDKIDEEAENEFFRIQQGEEFDPPEGKTVAAFAHLKGHQKQRAEQAHLLDKDALEELDRHILLTMRNAQEFQSEMIAEMQSNKMALQSGGLENVDGIGNGQRSEIPGDVQELGGGGTMQLPGSGGAGFEGEGV